MSNPYNLSNPYLQNQSQDPRWAGPGMTVPRGWTTNAAPPTETYQPSFNFQDYSPINLTSGLYDGVGYGKPIFYQNKKTGKYSAYKNEYSLGGDMYAKLNADWVKSIGGKDGGFGWEFDFDPTSQLYGNESNALVGRKIGNQNSLKAVGGELLRIASIPAMAYGVAALQGSGAIGAGQVAQGASNLQPIAATGAGATGGLSGAASTGVGAGAGTSASGIGAGAGSGLTATAPTYGYTVGGATGSGLGLTAGSGGTATGLGLSGAGAAGSQAAAGAGLGSSAFGGASAATGGGWLNSILGGAKQGLSSMTAKDWLGAGLGVGQGLLQYQQGQDLMDIARRASEGNRALAEPERQQYQQLLSQYFSGGQDITQQPMVAAALDRAKRENEAQLARLGMTGSGRALTSVGDYTNKVFQESALPYLNQLSGQAGFGFGPSGAGSTYGGIASAATGANNQAWGSLINGLTSPNPASQPWWWHANNAQNQMTQVPGAGTYARYV